MKQAKITAIYRKNRKLSSTELTKVVFEEVRKTWQLFFLTEIKFNKFVKF